MDEDCGVDGGEGGSERMGVGAGRDAGGGGRGGGITNQLPSGLLHLELFRPAPDQA